MRELFAIVQRQRPAPPSGGMPQTFFLADAHADSWSSQHDDASVLDYDRAQVIAKACGGTAQILSAEEQARLAREQQPPLPRLARWLET